MNVSLRLSSGKGDNVAKSNLIARFLFRSKAKDEVCFTYMYMCSLSSHSSPCDASLTHLYSVYISLKLFTSFAHTHTHTCARVLKMFSFSPCNLFAREKVSFSLSLSSRDYTWGKKKGERKNKGNTERKRNREKERKERKMKETEGQREKLLQWATHRPREVTRKFARSLFSMTIQQHSMDEKEQDQPFSLLHNCH